MAGPVIAIDPEATVPVATPAGPDPAAKIAVISPEGVAGTIPLASLDAALKAGFKLEDPAATEARAARKEAESHTGIHSGAPAQFGEGVLSSITGGASDVFYGSIASEEGKKRAAAERQVHSGARLAGEIGGLVAPVGAGSLATRAGSAVKSAVVPRLGGGLAGRVAGSMAKGATEFGLISAGQGVSELGLSADPVTAERALGVIGSHALEGVGWGVAFGGVGGLMGEAGKYAKTKMEHYGKVASGEIPKDVAKMGAAELHAAEGAEIGRIGLEREAVLAPRVYEQAASHADWLRKGENFVVTSDKQLTARIAKNKRIFIDSLDSGSKGLMRDPGRAQAALEKWEFATSKAIPELEAKVANPAFKVPRVRAGLSAEAKLPFAEQVTRAATRVEKTGVFGDRQVYISDVFSKMPARTRGTLDEFKAKLVAEQRAGGLELVRGDLAGVMNAEKLAASKTVTMPEIGAHAEFVRLPDNLWAMRAQFKKGSAELSARVNQEAIELARTKATAQAQRELDVAVEGLRQSRAVQAQLAALRAEAKSPLLDAIRAQRAEVQAGGKSMLRGEAGALAGLITTSAMMSAGTPFLLAAGAGVFARAGALKLFSGGKMQDFAAAFGKKVTARAAKTERAVDSLLSSRPVRLAGEVARKAAAVALVTDRKKEDAREHRNYQRAEQAIRSQVQTAPDGKMMMSGPARNALHERLAGLRALDAQLAAMVEASAAKRVEYLASKLPQRPAPAAMMDLGTQPWRPSDYERRGFERYVRAATGGPDEIIDRAARGEMTVQDAEVLRELFPAMLQNIQLQLTEKRAQIQRSVPYQRRLTLSMMFDVPLDPSMEPAAIDTLQSIYEEQEAQQQEADASRKRGAKLDKLSTQEPTQAQRITQ